MWDLHYGVVNVIMSNDSEHCESYSNHSTKCTRSNNYQQIVAHLIGIMHFYMFWEYCNQNLRYGIV